MITTQSQIGLGDGPLGSNMHVEKQMQAYSCVNDDVHYIHGDYQASLENSERLIVEQSVLQDLVKGTALGHLMWAVDDLGNVYRRCVFWGARAGQIPLVSDRMAMAAMTYRRLWTLWRRDGDLPKAHVSAIDPSSERVGADRRYECQQNRLPTPDYLSETQRENAWSTMRLVDQTLRACQHGELVRQVVTTVVLEDFCPPPLFERQIALRALRQGLSVLEKYFLPR